MGGQGLVEPLSDADQVIWGTGHTISREWAAFDSLALAISLPKRAGA